MADIYYAMELSGAYAFQVDISSTIALTEEFVRSATGTIYVCDYNNLEADVFVGTLDTPHYIQYYETPAQTWFDINVVSPINTDSQCQFTATLKN